MTTTPVVELKQISSDVYSAAPLQPSTTNNSEGPSIILMFGWMEGKVSHTKKYMNSYAKLYPHASQILVRSRQAFFWKGKASKESALLSVIDLLRKGGMFKAAPAPSLLVHVFSNGGGFQLVELNRILESKFPAPASSASATAIIYDSVPGKAGLIPALTAFTAPIKSPLGRIILSIPLTVVYFVLVAITFVTRQRPMFDQLRSGLNKAQVLPWTNENTPRLYIYSDTDEMVQEKAVAEHIAEAKELGLNVRAEYFSGSAHVSHARSEPERYWDAVKSAWADAVAVKT